MALLQLNLRRTMINDKVAMKYLKCHCKKNWVTIIVKLIHKRAKLHRWVLMCSTVTC